MLRVWGKETLLFVLSVNNKLVIKDWRAKDFPDIFTTFLSLLLRENDPPKDPLNIYI